MLQEERNYEFRKRLLKTHKDNIRNHHEKPISSEFCIEDGCSIIVSENAGDVILTAAKDFVDYLFTSMELSAMIKRGKVSKRNKGGSIVLSVKKETNTDLEEVATYMGYRIEIDKDIHICGYDERGVAQALYYLEDLMSIRKAPYLQKDVIKRKPMFSPRMIHSGYGLDQFPNEHLSSIAHAGRDAILVFTKGVDQTPYGYLDFNELIYRARKYGIDVYAYSYLVSNKHPDELDAKEYYDNLYGSLFEKCPKLKGIVLVGESVEFPSKDEHVSGTRHINNHVEGIPTGKPSPGWWPCSDYPKWLGRVKEAVYQHNKEADVVFWTYNWGYAPKEDRIKLIESLPTDISLLVTYEMFEPYQLEKTKGVCADYTLSFSGPGKYFVSEAEKAKERGIRLYTMSNTGGLSWDIGVIPYEPMPYQWIKRYKGLAEAHDKWGLCGLMESHHYGFWPSFISVLSKEVFFEPAQPYEEVLKDILSRFYGKDNVAKVDEALRLWSEAITYYIPTNEDQYGAFRVGPSYPLCLDRIIKPPSAPYAMFGNRILYVDYPIDYGIMVSHIDEKCSLISVKIHEEIASLNKMLKLLDDGIKILEIIEDKNDELLYLINLGKFIRCCTQTGINAKKWYILKSTLKIENDYNRLEETINDMERLANEEIRNAESAIPLVNADSRLGWEPSMEYMTDEEHIRWKIRQVRFMLDTELNCYKKRFMCR
ncbi:MAG: hypothetical protein PHH48_09160 [Eubacteriales bacterium]|nr:hypothetical protein [Eubacteriales bacterium]